MARDDDFQLRINYGLIIWPEVGEVLAGGQIPPEQATKLFTIIWRYHQYGELPAFPPGDIVGALVCQWKARIDKEVERAAKDSIGKAFKVYCNLTKPTEQIMLQTEWANTYWPEAVALTKGKLHGVRNADKDYTVAECILSNRAGAGASAGASAGAQAGNYAEQIQNNTYPSNPQLTTQTKQTFSHEEQEQGVQGGSGKFACDAISDLRQERRNRSLY